MTVLSAIDECVIDAGETEKKVGVTARGYDPAYINKFSKSLLEGFYTRDGETIDDALVRAATAYCFGDYELAQRIYEAAHDGWFMFASPILSNAPLGIWIDSPVEQEWRSGDNITDKYWRGEKTKAMPISCFALFIPDTIDGQIDATCEIAALSVSGGGVGLHNGIRATGGKAPGPIPYMKTVDAAIGYYRQGKCYAPGTEVLTENGWVKFEDLEEDTRVASVHEDGTIELVVPNELVAETHEGKMIRFFNRKLGFGITVTDDHSMVVKKHGDKLLTKVRASEVPETGADFFLCNDTLNIEDVDREEYQYEGLVYCAVVDSGMLVVRAGSVPLVCGNTRRGSCAWYMDVSHPDIIEHIKFRNATGGDGTRKADNRTQFHVAVNITDEFIEAVNNDDNFDLRCPHTGEVRDTMKARKIWETILETRALTGEPYLFKPDTANRALPQTQKDLGLSIKASNLCNEITLPTNEDRTFVCCLSSLNLEKYDEWKDTSLVQDLVRFLDNVLQSFIETAPPALAKAVFSAKKERALGVGTMGWHYYLQSKAIPYESGGFGSAIQETHRIFSRLKASGVNESLVLGEERGEPDDMLGSGRRNSAIFALAPNSNNSVILGTSPSIEPLNSNAFNHSTRAGSHLVKNPYLQKALETYAYELNHDENWIEEQWVAIIQAHGSVQALDFMSDEHKKLFKTAFELDQHWVIEQADARQQYLCQSQSLNLFFPTGSSAAYYNSVHLKALNSEYVKGLYYSRMESVAHADVVKKIERKAMVDWQDSDVCVACEG